MAAMNEGLPPHLQKFMALADGTLTLREMAAVLGVTYYTVGNYMRVLRSLGYFPAAKDGRTVSQSQRKALTKGTRLSNPLLRELPDPIVTWLMGQVPPGAHVYDVVRAIITDAYHDH